MTLHDRTTKSLLHLHKKKKPPSISAQFQVGDCCDHSVPLGAAWPHGNRPSGADFAWKISGFFPWDLSQVGFITWLKLDFRGLCSAMKCVSSLYPSAWSLYAGLGLLLVILRKGENNHRGLLCTMGWNTILYGHWSETTLSLRKQLCCCQRQLKRLVSEGEKCFRIFHFRLPLISYWRRWVKLSRSSSAASAPMLRR